jgi:hypothetical protein
LFFLTTHTFETMQSRARATAKRRPRWREPAGRASAAQRAS